MIFNSISYFRATIKEVRNSSKQTCPMVLLTDISYPDGTLFRDHVWVKWSKRLSKYSRKDRIAFQATITPYIASYGPNVGLTSIRYISLLKESQC